MGNPRIGRQRLHLRLGAAEGIQELDDDCAHEENGGYAATAAADAHLSARRGGRNRLAEKNPTRTFDPEADAITVLEVVVVLAPPLAPDFHATAPHTRKAQRKAA